MIWFILVVVLPCASAWFVTRLMNQGDFDPTCFLASLAGALLFPPAVALLSWRLFGRVLDVGALYDIKPLCAGAFIGCLALDAVKALRA